MRRISTTERRHRLALRHRLSPSERVDEVSQIAEDLVALHSSDPATVFLSVGARMRHPSVAPVEAALYDERSLVRHHAFRRTLWVMTPRMAGMAHGSATAKIAVVEQRKLLEQLEGVEGIDDGRRWYSDAVDEIRALLIGNGPTTTREIGKLLPHLARAVPLARGTKNPVEVAAHTRIVLVAGFQAALVRTAPAHGWNTAEYAWSDTERWLGAPLTGVGVADASAAVLAQWLERFGPATETDIRWWTGWTVAQMRAALGDIGAEPVGLDDDQSGWIAADDAGSPEAEPWVAMLPGLDPTSMGWKERGWYLSSAAAKRTFDRWGNAGPTIWRNGEVIGAWAQRSDGTVAHELFTELTSDERLLLDEQIERFTSFVTPTVVRVRFPAPSQADLLGGSR